MTSTLFLDLETFSSVDLRKSGVYRYAESPDFEILMAAWSVDDGPVQIAFTRDEILAIPGLKDPGVLKVAHNAQFERVCFSAFLGMPPGEYLDPESWDDTAARAAACGFPRSLDAVAKALEVSEKDSAGTLLINWFCKPDRKGQRKRPEDHPEKWQQFADYCIQDVVTLGQVRRALPEWPPGEREVWLIDQRINDRGIAIDQDMALAAVRTDEAARERASAEMCDLLGINNAGSVIQITESMRWRFGVQVPDLRSETVDGLLKTEKDPKVRRALELRKQTSLVAAKKYQAALNACSSDGRLRGQFMFYGAHTGRWSSRGVQIQNLPRVSVGQVEENILDLKLGFDPGPEMLKALVRSLFVGPFTVVDYSAIEARGLAWLAGEEWVLDAFRAKRDIYVETAKRMSTPGRPMDRQQGKVAVLALGYQGGVNALRGMGAEGTDEELRDIVYKYRDANPRIRRIWQTAERVFVEGGRAGRVEVVKDGRDRHLVLPSGRALVYRRVKVTGQGRERQISFEDPKKKGARADTYGGRLTENAVQAVCRDILAQALQNLEQAGISVVGHVHDEVIVEGVYPVERIEDLICRMPAWAEGLPLDAEGFVTQRYRKG